MHGEGGGGKGFLALYLFYLTERYRLWKEKHKNRFCFHVLWFFVYFHIFLFLCFLSACTWSAWSVRNMIDENAFHRPGNFIEWHHKVLLPRGAPEWARWKEALRGAKQRNASAFTFVFMIFLLLISFRSRAGWKSIKAKYKSWSHGFIFSFLSCEFNLMRKWRENVSCSLAPDKEFMCFRRSYGGL